MAEKSKAVRSSKSAPQGLRGRLKLSTEQIIVGACIGGTLLILAVFGFRTFQNSYNRSISIEGVQVVPVVSGQHLESGVNYTQIPPAGGPHNPVWQNCGVYETPIRDEHAVHSLEHGAVWITYDPASVPQEQIDRLADITRQSSHRLLSPYPGIDSPIILTSWGYQLRLDSADDARLMQFINKYESGPTTPEPGAVCSGGTSQTLSF